MSGQLVRNTVSGSLGGAASTFSSFVSAILVAQLLGPEGAGAITYALWCIAIATTIADLGLGIVLQRFVADLAARGKQLEAERLVGTAARLRLLSIVFAAAACYLALRLGISGSEAAAVLGQPLLLALVVVSVAVQSLSSLYSAFLKGRQWFGRLAAHTLVAAALQVVVVGLGAWQGGVPGALAGYAVAVSAMAVCGLQLLRFGAGLTVALRRKIVRFALISWSAGLVGGLVASRVEILFLESYVDLRAVGLFAAATSLASLATTVPTLLTSALLAYFSQQHGLGNHAQMAAVYRTAVLTVALLALPACFGMAAITSVLVPLLFGTAFAEAAVAATILLAPAAVYVLGAPNSNLIYGSGRSGILLASSLAGLATTVLLSLLLIPRLGLIGAACARAAMQFLTVTIETGYVGFRLGITPPWSGLARVTLAAAAAGAAAFGLISAVGGLTGLTLAVPTGVLVYLFALRWSGAPAQLDSAVLDRAAAASPLFMTSIVRFLYPGWRSAASG